MSKTLLQPYELIAIAAEKVLKNSTPQFYCVPILTEERMLFSCYFGMGLYRDMLADLIDYSSSAIPFRPNVPYAVGDIILYNGIYKEVILATTGIQTPDTSLYFKTPKKFNSASYQYLWDNYLAIIISYQVVAVAASSSTVQMSETGARVAKSESYEAASQGQISLFVRVAEDTVRKNIMLLEDYVLQNQQIYPMFEFLRNDCVDKCGRCHVCKTSKTRLGYGRRTTNFSLEDL
jgi:hypothetical protein